MSDTVIVPISSKEFTKVNTARAPITVEAKKTPVHVAVSTTKPTANATAIHLLRENERIHFAAPTADIWVKAATDVPTAEEVAVTEEVNTVEVTARGGSGQAVFIQDQTTGVLGLRFVKEIVQTALAANISVGDRTITLAPGHGLVSPTNEQDIIEVADNTDGTRFMQCEIVSIAGDVVTIDCPANFAYTIANSTVVASSPKMKVDGSVTPQVFSVAPLSNQSGDITRVIFAISDNADMDFETFGAIAALPGKTFALLNGCVLRVNNGDGTYRNLYNFHSNGDIIAAAFDHDFLVNNGGGIRAFDARLTFAGQAKHGVAIRLDGALSEALEIVVQDDLTTLEGFGVFAQGSELQE